MARVFVIARKHKCNKVFCPQCSRYHHNEYLNRIKILNYKYLRHVILTIDPKKYSASLDSYRFLTKQVSYFIKDLKRYEKLNIIRYIKVLEFHKNGLPHFHLLIELDRIGMINKEVIEKHWQYGLVWEDYFKDLNHWNKFTGYFQKQGYIEHKGESKQHQLSLPEWGLKTNEVIRKFIYSFNYFKTPKIKDTEKKEKKENPSNKTRCQNTNEYRLEQCGNKTKIECCVQGQDWQETALLNIPFRKFLQVFNGELEYRETIGYILKIEKRVFYTFLKEWDNEIDLCIVDRINEGYLKYVDIERKIDYYRNI